MLRLALRQIPTPELLRLLRESRSVPAVIELLDRMAEPPAVRATARAITRSGSLGVLAAALDALHRSALGGDPAAAAAVRRHAHGPRGSLPRGLLRHRHSR